MIEHNANAFFFSKECSAWVDHQRIGSKAYFTGMKSSHGENLIVAHSHVQRHKGRVFGVFVYSGTGRFRDIEWVVAGTERFKDLVEK